MLSRTSPPDSTEPNARTFKLVFAIYCGLIVYGSLFPFSPWKHPQEPLFWGLTHFPSSVSRSDLLANVLIYLPVGALWMWMRKARTSVAAIIVATLIGASLSFTMESLQMFLPRDSSITDLLANTSGTAVGAAAAAIIRVRLRMPSAVLSWQAKNIRPGSPANLGALSILVWIASQLFPFVPSLDVSTVRQSLSPAWQTLHHLSTFDPYRFLTYTAIVSGLICLSSALASDRSRAMAVISFLFLLTMAAKPLIVSRAISLEAAIGMVSGVVIGNLVGRSFLDAFAAVVFIISGLILLEIAPGTGAAHSFNWIPFSGEEENVLNGFQRILEITWQPVALTALLFDRVNVRSRSPWMWAGAVAFGCFFFVMEWKQQLIPGRYPGITPALVSPTAWVLAWYWSINADRPQSMAESV